MIGRNLGMGASPDGDRATLASPQAPAGLGHAESVPSAAFTPGPWRIEPHAKFGGTQMYWVNDFTSVGTQITADVKLIAAAPDLYEALEAADAVLEATRAGRNVRRHIHAALAKARGDTQ